MTGIRGYPSVTTPVSPDVHVISRTVSARTMCRRSAVMSTTSGMPCGVTPPYVFPVAALGVRAPAGPAVAAGIIGEPMRRAPATAPTVVTRHP